MEENIRVATLDGMRIAGKLASQVLDMITDYVKPGITTIELDNIMNQYIIRNGGISACKGYYGYPRYTCISVNHVVCHGIPSDKKLKNGDVVNIDVTVIVDGMYGDTSRMFIVGKPSIKAERVCRIAKDAMVAGIEQIKPGATVGDIGYAIQKVCEQNKVNAVKEFCGHSIGTFFHGDIQVPSFGTPGLGYKLKVGDFITVEPIITLGRDKVHTLPDKWTVVTNDRCITAQWEHTIAVVENGYEIMTLS